MYYVEAWINGKLCWKSSPRGEWKAFTMGQYKERVKQLEKQVENLTLQHVIVPLKCGNTSACDYKLGGNCTMNVGECNLQE
jgi:hypothetical protein